MCSTEDATAGDHPIMPPRVGCVKSSSPPPTRRTVVEASLAERVGREFVARRQGDGRRSDADRDRRGVTLVDMAQPTPRPAAIVAVTSEDDRHAAVIKRAAAVADSAGSTVILWDRDAASPLESPLPTDWSGDGEQEQFGDRLDPDDLITAGREPLARQVGELRKAGIDAWAWLPSSAGAEDLAAYAADQRADLILVSADDGDLAADLRDVVEREKPGSAGGLRVETVPA
jgi:methylmalonyl-CoA mutase cobalamin-binding subunit